MKLGAVEVKTASGDVRTASVRDGLTCHSASGDVRCDGTAAKTKIRTASGSVRLTAEVPSEISIQTVSGNVVVTVERGLEVDVDATSISGRLTSTMPLDSAEGGSTSSDVVSISAKTVSGQRDHRFVQLAHYLMGGVLMTNVLSRFELESGMGQVEVTGQAVLKLIEDPRRLTVGEADVVNNNVRRKRRKARHDHPRMQIVDADHVLHRQEMLMDLGEIYARRRRF